jgi:hypothetical protein
LDLHTRKLGWSLLRGQEQRERASELLDLLLELLDTPLLVTESAIGFLELRHRLALLLRGSAWIAAAI